MDKNTRSGSDVWERIRATENTYKIGELLQKQMWQ